MTTTPTQATTPNGGDFHAQFDRLKDDLYPNRTTDH